MFFSICCSSLTFLYYIASNVSIFLSVFSFFFLPSISIMDAFSSPLLLPYQQQQQQPSPLTFSSTSIPLSTTLRPPHSSYTTHPFPIPTPFPQPSLLPTPYLTLISPGVTLAICLPHLLGSNLPVHNSMTLGSPLTVVMPCYKLLFLFIFFFSLLFFWFFLDCNCSSAVCFDYVYQT